MAFRRTHSFWIAVDGRGTRRHDEPSSLPPNSVVISDQKRHANKLGEGSFAKVYKGKYNGKLCAVKVFKEDVLKKELSTEPENEVEMLSKVQHPNVVQMYGIWLDPNQDRAAPSIVMELCDESLYDFIKRLKGKPVSKEKKVHILQDIARGMVYLHDQNIIHGDLRSTNVLLCHSGDQIVAKLADFVMARLIDPDTQHHYTTRFTDEEYLPPEAFDHKEHKDPKKKCARLTPEVDVFCFGQLLLEMMCGAYPTPTGKFHGRGMLTELQRREKHLLKLKQSDKESFNSIIRKCLADAPEGRPSFTEILLDVEGQLHMYGERPDLDMLQDKTAECEVLRAQVSKMATDAKEEWDTLADEKKSLQDELMLTKQELLQKEQRLQDLEKDKERSLSSISGVGVIFQKYEATMQELREAQRKEHNLNAELRQYRDDLEATKSAESKLNQSKMVLEDVKTALEKQVKELTFELEVRAEDLCKKEEKIVRLTRDVKDAHEIIAEGKTLETELNERIKELEREKKNLLDVKAQLEATLVSYEANRNQMEAAQLQRFQAMAERDKYMEMTSTLQQKLLEKEEAKLACEKENHLLRREVADAKKRYQYLKDEKEFLVDQQSVYLDDLHSRFLALQSELESVKEENDIVKIHRLQYNSNLRQLASEHLHMRDKLVAVVQDSVDVMHKKMVHNIKEFTSLDTAQETVAERVKEAESQYQAAESELRKLERETENYRRKLLDLPHPTEEQLYNHVVPAVAAKWREVATYLGLESHVITSVHVDQSSAEDSCLKVLLRWMDGAGKQPKTWVTVLEAMRRADFTETARELEVKIRSNSL